jgi:hypothetical protein
VFLVTDAETIVQSVTGDASRSIGLSVEHRIFGGGRASPLRMFVHVSLGAQYVHDGAIHFTYRKVGEDPSEATTATLSDVDDRAVGCVSFGPGLTARLTDGLVLVAEAGVSLATDQDGINVPVSVALQHPLVGFGS